MFTNIVLLFVVSRNISENSCIYIDLWESEMWRLFFRVVLMFYVAVGRCFVITLDTARLYWLMGGA